MLTIKTLEDSREIQAFFEREGLTYTPAQEQFMALRDGDAILGLGSLTLCGAKVYMNFLHAAGDDFALCHGLAKALLNMADLRGIKMIYGSNPKLDKFYALLRFQQAEGEYVLSLEGYFTTEGC